MKNALIDRLLQLASATSKKVSSLHAVIVPSLADPAILRFPNRLLSYALYALCVHLPSALSLLIHCWS